MATHSLTSRAHIEPPVVVNPRPLPGYLAQPPVAITLARGRRGRPMSVLGQP